MRFPLVRSGVALAVLAAVVAGPAPQAVADCADEPAYATNVTSPSLAAPGFPYRRVLTSEINAYVTSVDTQSDRVTSGVLATSTNGTDLTYALVSSPENLARVDEIAVQQDLLRDPRVTDADQAAAIAADTPAIVWYSGNVHGNETSGADAAISLLYDLAARTDCAATEILDNLVVGIIPTQNPDGRDLASRQNAYGFDMNRDWFARTQPETAGKLDLLAKYPPVLFIDAHEMGSSDFFFPPNADPIHHEISAESLGWINNLYGEALRDTFATRQADEPTEWNYFNYNTYDLFYMGYGDTVPTTAFGAAGMTFEKGTADTDEQRHKEQFAAGWTSLRQAATHRQQILAEHYAAHVRAVEDGEAGRLEPNLVVEPQNTVQFEVPQQTIRNYFLLPTRGQADVQRLVDRLLRTDVEVYRLTDDLRVEDLRRYGRPATADVVPAGSYWIPMAQPQKRWIQALLGEDPYTPFPYFYDVTSWSNPLLMNVEAVLSASELKPKAEPVTALPAVSVVGEVSDVKSVWFTGDSAQAVAAALALDRAGYDVRRTETQLQLSTTDTLPAGSFVVGSPDVMAMQQELTPFLVELHASSWRVPDAVPAFSQPRIAVFKPATGDVAAVGEAYGHLRYVLERDWDIPYTPVTGVEVAAGMLTNGDYDVLLVPGVSTTELTPAASSIRSWIEAGGVYVGTARSGATGGTPFAVSNGYTTATTTALTGAQVGGTAFRVDVQPGASPVTLGAADEAFWFNLGEQVLTPSTTGVNAITYSADTDFWFSGFGTGVEPLAGTAGLVDEKLGEGHVVLFSGEPNYRAYTEGPAFFLANAVAYREQPEIEATDVRLAPAAVAAARATAAPETGPGRPISIAVPRAQAALARQVLTTFTPARPAPEAPWGVRSEPAGATVVLRVPNPRGLDVESHPFIYKLRPALERAGVSITSALF